MNILKWILITAFLTGCTASQVISPGSNQSSPYAPVNEASRGGIVKYLNEGAGFVKRSRRESAYKKMYESCGGSYEIVKEGTNLEGGVIVPAGNSAVWANSQYVYIEYRCVSK